MVGLAVDGGRMTHHVCPWWLGYLLASPIRRWIQDPLPILSAHIRPGMTVLEPGPGMGFFTLPLARLVGPEGRVVAVDLQARMLAELDRRTARAGLARRVETRATRPDRLGVDDLGGQVDFVLAFAMVHELPEGHSFFAEVAAALKPGGTLLLAEPGGHVPEADFAAELDAAQGAGLKLLSRPAIKRTQAAVLGKPAG
jgi:SAM-dependent methyltransferase